MTTWLGVGLGNPGMRADVAETRLGTTGLGGWGGTDKVLLAKPRTFMNDSGIAVAKLAGFHKVEPAQVVAVHDELDLEPGQLRLKVGGGDNGHNGLRSLRAHLHTGDFARVRFGIGRPPGRMSVHDFVLSDVAAADRTELEVDLARAADAVEVLLGSGLVAAQNQFNS
jgi:peptidyl-tRNA hydrolase, PTH1 family